jgi:3-oxoadipate enol-lactonase
MPKITVGGLNVNYQIQGTGDPLLLIIGLSFSLLDWSTKLPELLSQHYKVILFDNRDAGETSKLDHAYTIAQMAEDAAGLLNALGESKAHVFGVSMGGMIAQHFALNHANQLNKLILGCTAAGGTCSEFGDVSGLLAGNILDLLFTPEFIHSHRPDLTQLLQTTAPFHSQGSALQRQLQAMGTHDTCNLLGKITAPTLVITGDRDPVIPSQNSDYLAKKIPGAKQVTITDASHGFCVSHPDETAIALIDFLNHKGTDP